MSIDDYIKKLMLPLIYVYSLSLGLIFLSAFLIINRGESSVSYAQSVNYTDEYEISINLSSNPNASVNDLNENQSPTAENICDNEIVRKIDKFYSLYPLADHGCDFYKHAQETQVDPLLVPAIGFCESTGGKVTPQFGNTESYNAWGWAVYDSNDTTKNVDGYACDTWEHCIGRVTRGIKRVSDSKNLGTTPEEVVTWYNPGSVQRANGIPGDATWTKCVKNTMNKIDNIKL